MAMKKEIQVKIDMLRDPDKTITGIAKRSKLDRNVIDFQFTDAQGVVLTGILPVHTDLIANLSETGRRIWHEGLVHNELMLTVPDGAALPMGIAIRFIRGMLDLYHESTPGITVKSFLDEEAKQVADKIAPRCYYAGCGTDDGWPTAK